jgi:hypothetical protein
LNFAKRTTVLKFASGVPPCTERTNTGYLALVACGKRNDVACWMLADLDQRDGIYVLFLIDPAGISNLSIAVHVLPVATKNVALKPPETIADGTKTGGNYLCQQQIALIVTSPAQHGLLPTTVVPLFVLSHPCEP